MKIYVNGQTYAAISFAGEAIGSVGDIWFGHDIDSPRMLLDDVRIYDHAVDVAMAAGNVRVTESRQFSANPTSDALRRRAELNLRKLRSGRNIAGVERIRSEPIPVELEVIDGELRPPPQPPLRPSAFRYAALIERAKQLVNIAQQTETAYLSALEKRDAEAYTLLNARHDVQFAKDTVELQDLRIKEADEGVVLMELHRDRAQEGFDTYDSWIDAGPSSYERKMLENYRDLARLRNVLAEHEVATTIANAAVTAATAGTFSKPRRGLCRGGADWRYKQPGSGSTAAQPRGSRSAGERLQRQFRTTQG